ncbi:MAG: helix-hairpin-helix domain-containing protein, partial [Sulfurimonas sp.]
MLKKFLVMLLLMGSLMAAMNVNKASKEDLMAISGIGEKKAEAIIKYRKKHGNYKSIDDLKNVKGIGEAIIANIKKGKKKSTKKRTASQKNSHSKKS